MDAKEKPYMVSFSAAKLSGGDGICADSLSGCGEAFFCDRGNTRVVRDQ